MVQSNCQTFVPLEEMLTSLNGFGLVQATPLQRAICRASDGLPLGDLWEREDVQMAFGGARPILRAPSEFVFLAAIRCGKSTIAAAKAVCASQNCDVRSLTKGEIPRIPIVSLKRDAAHATFDQHLAGKIIADPYLSSLLLDEPKADSLLLRHPTGRPVQVQVVALHRAGGSLISRWLAGCIFDEAPRMAGAQDGKLNLEESQRAIRGRMLPGAQIMYIGSPHAPFGPVFDMVQKHFGRPSAQFLVVRGRGPDLNPVRWTPEACEELRQADPDAYKTDVLAEFADPASAFFTSVQIETNSREHPMHLDPEPGVQYIATMDPATRGNAWTLLIVGNYGFKEGTTVQWLRVAFHKQWQGSKSQPLSPKVVLREAADHCARYGIDTIITDAFALDVLQDVAWEFALTLHGIHETSDQKREGMEALHLAFS